MSDSNDEADAGARGSSNIEPDLPVEHGAIPAEPELEPEPVPEAEPDPLEVARGEAKKLKDQLLRTAADFDNFRKRTVREVRDAERRGREHLLKDVLPVFDNLERAVLHADTASDVAPLVEGIRMVTRQFGDTLARLGIERVPAEGMPFDPAIHEAIQQLQTSDHAPGTIVAEVLAGYRFEDKLIRPAMVVVATAPPTPSREGDGSDADPAETPALD